MYDLRNYIHVFFFPRGAVRITKILPQVHDRNLKLGIFSDLGQLTGGKYPGTHGHRFHELDAQTFAEWDIDYVKMSAFNAFPRYVEDGKNVVFSK